MNGEADIWFTNLERFGMIGRRESFVGKLKYHFRKEMQQEKEMQGKEEANQKVQQQILRRKIDEELRQEMEKLHQTMEKLRECFSKGDNCVASLQNVAQEEEYEDEQLEHFGEKNQEIRNEKLKNINVNSETQADQLKRKFKDRKKNKNQWCSAPDFK
jgi:hexokinase